MTQSISVRRATLEDAPAIRDLTHAAYAKWVPVIGREPKPMTTDFTAAVQHHMIDLLFENGVLAGLIETVLAADHLLIENVAVAPEFQGRGHARTLLAHAEALARSLSQSEIRLYTNSRFTENLALYARYGYREAYRAPSIRGILVHMSKPV
jgi:ribosomal protein S18 acetylase RimI-like enzyme